MADLAELNQRLTNIVRDTCNVIGCDRCDLKYPGGCSAMILQDQIFDLEMKAGMDFNASSQPEEDHG